MPNGPVVTLDVSVLLRFQFIASYRGDLPLRRLCQLMRFVDVRGIKIATQAFGAPTDPALVMIMGATASMLSWPDELCVALADQGLYGVRFDHRDTGQSTTVPPGQALYSVEDLAADVIGILDDYRLARANILGMSLGGLIAQMLAINYPDRVKSLILMASEPLGWDGSPLPPISQPFMEHFANLATLDWSQEDNVVEFLLESDRLSAGSVPFDEERARARIKQILSRTNSPASMFNHASVAVRQDWSGGFRKITAPTLVIHGEEDPILPIANGKAIAKGIAGAELVAIPGVGHEIPLPQIGLIVNCIVRFLLK